MEYYGFNNVSDFKVHAINGLGENLPGFPKSLSDPVSSYNPSLCWLFGKPIVIADLDKDGKQEIVVSPECKNLEKSRMGER